MASAVTWQLDAEMYREKGWVGYTCRHPRSELPLDQLDQYEAIEWWDKGCEDPRWRNLSILLTAEFPARMAELRRQGREHSEVYLLTAFMTAVTILHEQVYPFSSTFSYASRWTRMLIDQLPDLAMLSTGKTLGLSRETCENLTMAPT